MGVLAAVAVHTSNLQKLQALPFTVWLKLALGIAIFVGAIIGIRKLAQTNKFLVFGVVGIFGFITVATWVYNRNEPAFMKPVVDFLSPFLPSAGSTAARDK